MALFATFLLSSSLIFASSLPGPGRYLVDKSASELRILVYKGGLLSRFGHNHVISTNDIDGYIEIDGGPSTIDVELSIPVESFEVDNDAIRLEEGEPFKKTVSEKDKRGTAKNMLGRKLLDATEFDDVTVRVLEWTGELPDITISAEFTVKGQANPVNFPASVTANNDQIIVTGKFNVTHEALGLKPFKAALGSLRVRDEMDLKFSLLARRVPD